MAPPRQVTTREKTYPTTPYGLWSQAMDKLTGNTTS